MKIAYIPTLVVFSKRLGEAKFKEIFDRMIQIRLKRKLRCA